MNEFQIHSAWQNERVNIYMLIGWGGTLAGRDENGQMDVWR